VRSVALGGGTGGELVLLSVQVCVKIDFFNEKKSIHILKYLMACLWSFLREYKFRYSNKYF
jgi:hypothetical protein